jgi:hypothetical protein
MKQQQKIHLLDGEGDFEIGRSDNSNPKLQDLKLDANQGGSPSDL